MLSCIGLTNPSCTATAGSLGEQDVVCEKHVTIQPAVAFKHMGLLDGLVVFGQWFLLPNTVPIAI